MPRRTRHLLLVALVASLLAVASGEPSVAAPGDAGTFRELRAQRILDTGTGLGAPKAAVPANGSVTVQVAGKGGVPVAGASAVLMRVIAGGSAAGSVIAYPTGQTRPATTSLSYGVGQTWSNLVVVPLGTGGKVTLDNRSSGTVRLLADVHGYYTSGTGTSPGAYKPVPTPTRVLDTKAGVGAPAAAVPGNGTLTLQLTGRGGVPVSGVGSVWLTLTATGGTGTGFVTAYRAGTTMPTATNLTYNSGETVTETVAVPVSSDGKITLSNKSASTVHLYADTQGYTVSGTPSQHGALQPVTPSRLPTLNLAANGKATVQLTGKGNIPTTGATSVLLAVSAGSATASGYVTIYPQGETRPSTPAVDFPAGRNVTNLALTRIGGAGSITVENTSTSKVTVILDTQAYYRGATWKPRTLPFTQPGPSTLGSDSIADISCPAPGQCIAIGNYAGFVPFASTLSNGTWTTMTLPAAPIEHTDYTRRPLTAISCTSLTSCVAVGERGLGYQLTASGWKTSSLPRGDTNFGYTDVSCWTAADCVAVGYSADIHFGNSEGVVARFLNGTWSRMARPADSDAFFWRHPTVACVAGGACVAVGEAGTSWRLSAGTWTNVPLPDTDPNFDTISCVSSTSCTSTGSDSAGSFVATFAGSSWTFTPSSLQSVPHNALACLPTASCRAASGSRVYTRAGTSWTSLQQPSPVGGNSPDLTTISCVSATSCVAGGTYVKADGTRALLAETLSGSTWGATTIPAPPGLVEAGFNDVACLSTGCVAVGAYTDATSVRRPLVSTWAGGTWTTVVLPLPAGSTSASLASVSCATWTSCTAGGSQQRSGVTSLLIERLASGAWTPLALNSPGTVASVSCVPAGTCLAVGGSKVTRIDNSGGWVDIVPPNTPRALTQVTCLTATLCVAAAGAAYDEVGSFRWNGSTWASMGTNPVVGYFATIVPTSLSCTSGTACLIGAYVPDGFSDGYPVTGNLIASIPHQDVATPSDWTSIRDFPQDESVEVSCYADFACVTVGSDGVTFARTNGTTTTALAHPSQPGVTTFIQGLSCTGSDDCVAVGWSRTARGDKVPYVDVLS